MQLDICGFGAVSCIGGDPATIHDALCAGRTGVGPLRVFDTSKFHSGVAYEIDDRTDPDRDEPRRSTTWLLDAIAQALADAGLSELPDGCPVLVGTTHREQRSMELWWRGEAAANFGDLHFGTAIRERFGAVDTFTFANACAASLTVLGLAADMIEAGDCDTVVVAGTDGLTEATFGIFDRVQTGNPTEVRPFAAERHGMMMGEGAAAVVLRRAGHGGPVRARLRSVALNCDADHPTVPEPASVARVVRQAHERAAVAPGEIDLVLCHGTGTIRNDVVETAVLHEVFADAKPMLTAIKASTGHTLGGSGLLSLIMAAISLRERRVPPIRGLTEPMPEAEGLDLVRGEPRIGPMRMAQVDAFGLSGINAVAILEVAS
ncbi:beta-ketoacyl-[acyl-carrier-protein] synthase family protein [Nocardia crassostreae]|uniref:beta-ketoacyl-[acyl-carrier-protein] synthase family protein n=1 Tax=Nocardia crassostreae TaxID=53428 RepID=UPI00083418C2|nr:beta-ketoacyl synthase N-terminal-like domain-containing protein [Nocardia crassostreae]